MKLQKLDNEGKPTDVIVEYDDKVAKAMLDLPRSKWVEAKGNAKVTADKKDTEG